MPPVRRCWILRLWEGPWWFSPTQTLTGSVETLSQLESSTEFIVRDIDYLLMGKPFAASYRDGIITIGPRSAE